MAATGVRHDELTTLATIGALNAFGYDRREALWQVERAVRPAGALFEEPPPAGRAAGHAPVAAATRGRVAWPTQAIGREGRDAGALPMPSRRRAGRCCRSRRSSA